MKFANNNHLTLQCFKHKAEIKFRHCLSERGNNLLHRAMLFWLFDFHHGPTITSYHALLTCLCIGIFHLDIYGGPSTYTNQVLTF